jgi:hypothetical protein
MRSRESREWVGGVRTLAVPTCSSIDVVGQYILIVPPLMNVRGAFQLCGTWWSSSSAVTSARIASQKVIWCCVSSFMSTVPSFSGPTFFQHVYLYI